MLLLLIVLCVRIPFSTVMKVEHKVFDCSLASCYLYVTRPRIEFIYSLRIIVAQSNAVLLLHTASNLEM